MSFDTTFKYYLGSLATSTRLTTQASELRTILFSNNANEVLFLAVQDFISDQHTLESDTANLLNKALLPGYGSEYLGLAGNDWQEKADYYSMLIEKFPSEISFKFYYADCACMAGFLVDRFYPVLEMGMLMDTAREYYPSVELFEAINDSVYNFQFDLLLLDKYYQPCTQTEFEDYVNEFKEAYSSPAQLTRLNSVRWKGYSNQ